MKANTTTSYREKWLWDPAPLRILVGGWILLWVILALASYPLLGMKSLHFLWGIWAGPFFWVVYRSVGGGVERLCQEASASGFEAVPSLIVSGLLQRPGIIILEPDILILHGVRGKRITIPWRDITAYREVRWFNGTRYFCKTGFWLTVPGRDRLGVAVPDSSAELLRRHLKQAASPRPPDEAIQTDSGHAATSTQEQS